MDKVISFIIPAYNSQQYIKKCLDTFLVPEVLDKIEVIVVNDGSEDQTEAIVQAYVNAYPEVYRLFTKENGGHGSAINEGVCLASGRYLKVIDADDWIYSKDLHPAVMRLEQCEAQVVIMPYHTIDMATGKRRKYGLYGGYQDEVCTLEKIVENWREFEHGLTFHGVIYKTDFYRARGIRLVEHVFYEDYEYAAVPFCFAQTILPVKDISLYEYQIGNSQQSVAVENQIKRLGHMEQVLEHMADFYREEKRMPEIGKAYFYKKLEGLLLSYYRTVYLLSPDKREGVRRANIENQKLFSKIPEWKKVMKQKYRIFFLLSLCNVNARQYEGILNSRIYKAVRGKYC